VRVTFIKKERRYGIYVSRDRATDLVLETAPGYDPRLPHDLLHFVAEAEFGLDGGVFGDLASGGHARMFVPVDRSEIPKLWRAKRIKKVALPDGRRSEQLADHLQRGWAARTLEPELLAKLDALAQEWHSLPVGGELTLEWPRAERGKRASRPANAAGSARRDARSAARSTPAAVRGGRARRS
jgi:hypothetical protein